jgi:hypothetical protein
MARIDGLQDRGDWKANGWANNGRENDTEYEWKFPKSSAAHDWLAVAKRAMCVSPGQQIARLKEDRLWA